MSTIFGDYVAGFLGTIRQGNSYRLQPFDVSVSYHQSCGQT